MLKLGESRTSLEDDDKLPLEIEVDTDLPIRRLACAVLVLAFMDLKEADEYHRSTARDCEASHVSGPDAGIESSVN